MKLEKGINLQIDSSITTICELSNRSSSQTRAVMYLIVIAAFIQLVVVLNTFNGSWQNLKYKNDLERINRDIRDISNQNKGSNLFEKDLISEKQKYDFQEKLQIERFHVENFTILRVPIINMPIHVNDTGLVSGMLLCILYFILLITLEREEINLCLALNAIHHRYSDDSDAIKFKEELEVFGDKDKKEILKDINLKRRSYHYNLLTMNEIFIKPNISINLKTTDSLSKRIKTKALNYKYYFGFGVFCLSMLFDILTRKIGYNNYSIDRTVAHIVSMVIAFMVLFYLMIKCKQRSSIILNRYNNFKESGYTFNPNSVVGEQ